ESLPPSSIKRSPEVGLPNGTRIRNWVPVGVGGWRRSPCLAFGPSGEVPARKDFVRRCPRIQPPVEGSRFYCLGLPASVVVRHRISVKSHSSRERRRRCRQAENQR